MEDAVLEQWAAEGTNVNSLEARTHGSRVSSLVHALVAERAKHAKVTGRLVADIEILSHENASLRDDVTAIRGELTDAKIERNASEGALVDANKEISWQKGLVTAANEEITKLAELLTQEQIKVGDAQAELERLSQVVADEPEVTEKKSKKGS